MKNRQVEYQSRGVDRNLGQTISNQVATSEKQIKGYEELILQKTNFEIYKVQFFQICETIQSMRVIERLGKYTQKEKKINIVKDFKIQFEKLRECLKKILEESLVYKTMVQNSPRPKRTTSTKSSKMDQKNQFQLKLRKIFKQIQNTWKLLFQEGSLKKLIIILTLLKINNFEFPGLNMDIDIWSENVLTNFEAKKQAQKGCCQNIL